MDNLSSNILFGIGLGLGIGIGIALALVLFRRTIYTEVVRDHQGRIVQIIEMSDIQPLIGRRVLNVSNVGKPIEATTP